MTAIKIEQPDAARLAELGVEGWSPWECEPSKFDWEYSATETAYVREGRVVVTPTGGPGGDSPAVEVVAGDLVTFPAGMQCTWEVKETIRKVYRFE